MGQLLHGGARTTETVRRAIQRSEESIRALAQRHGISPTTVQKWRKRASVGDARTGPKAIHSTVLTIEEEATIVAFPAPLSGPPRHQPPTRDGRRQTRHAKVRLRPHRHRRVHTGDGKLQLFVAIDRTSKLAFARLYEQADRPTAVLFLEALIETVPYRLHTILTDNGIQFADRRLRLPPLDRRAGTRHIKPVPRYPGTKHP